MRVFGSISKVGCDVGFDAIGRGAGKGAVASADFLVEPRAPVEPYVLCICGCDVPLCVYAQS